MTLQVDEHSAKLTFYPWSHNLKINGGHLLSMASLSQYILSVKQNLIGKSVGQPTCVLQYGSFLPYLNSIWFNHTFTRVRFIKSGLKSEHTVQNEIQYTERWENTWEETE